MKTLALVSCASLLAIGSANAQEFSSWSFSVGGGFTQPVGNTGRQLDEGWNAGVGGGFNFNPYLGAMIDLNYNSFGVSSGTLGNIGVPGGSLHVFSATLDPIVHLNPHSHYDIYLTGGGGIFHQYQQFTQPTGATAFGYDPFFGFGGNGILNSYSVNRPGIDAGAGIALGTRWHGKIYAEARYNRIFIGNYHTDYVPVTFGFRW